MEAKQRQILCSTQHEYDKAMLLLHIFRWMNVNVFHCLRLNWRKKRTVQPMKKRLNGKQRRLKYFFLNGYFQSGTIFAYKWLASLFFWTRMIKNRRLIRNKTNHMMNWFGVCIAMRINILIATSKWVHARTKSVVSFGANEVTCTQQPTKWQRFCIHHQQQHLIHQNGCQWELNAVTRFICFMYKTCGTCF